MNRKFTWIFAALTLFLGACGGGSKEEIPPEPEDESLNHWIQDGRILADIGFTGTSETVTGDATDNPFVDESAKFTLSTTSAGQTTIYMHAVRFASAMPAVEMRIPNVPISGTEKTLQFARASVTPEAFIAAANDWVPYDRYQITDLSGSLEDADLTFVFTCANLFHVTVTAKLVGPVQPE